MKTGPKRILANFREYAHVSHYWAAKLVTTTPEARMSFKSAHPHFNRIEIALWSMIQFLAWAEQFRADLVRIPHLEAASWGMRPRLLIHCSQQYVPLATPPDALLAELADYQNPNMGPLK